MEPNIVTMKRLFRIDTIYATIFLIVDYKFQQLPLDFTFEIRTSKATDDTFYGMAWYEKIRREI